MLSEYSILIRLLLALLLGGVIGLEREIHGREAGFRTHILVTLGSTLITLVSIFIAEEYADNSLIFADPTRIAAQIVTGVGFLGAGTIMRFGSSVRGLTTAASLWAMASVGIALGAGFYYAGILASALVFLSLFILTRIDRFLFRRDLIKIIKIETSTSSKLIDTLRKILKHQATISNYNVVKKEHSDIMIFEICIQLTKITKIDEITEKILSIESIKRVEWIV